MKIIVMSDSHGKCGNLIDIGLSQRDADAFIFLGDGWRDFEDFSLYFNDKLCISVKGNCDLGCSADNEKIIFLGGKKFLIAHGHTFSVKFGFGKMIAEAKRNECDIMLYGHTHIAHNEYRDGLYILNPGSAGKGVLNSYGIIEITPSGIMTNIVKI